MLQIFQCLKTVVTKVIITAMDIGFRITCIVLAFTRKTIALRFPILAMIGRNFRIRNVGQEAGTHPEAGEHRMNICFNVGIHRRDQLKIMRIGYRSGSFTQALVVSRPIFMVSFFPTILSEWRGQVFNLL